jgi:hypothetical protein
MLRPYLSVFRRETVKTLLNYMVAIQILNQLNYSIFQSFDNGLNLIQSQRRQTIKEKLKSYLLSCRDELDHLLQCTSPMLIKSNLDHLWCSVVDQYCALIVV